MRESLIKVTELQLEQKIGLLFAEAEVMMSLKRLIFLKNLTKKEMKHSNKKTINDRGVRITGELRANGRARILAKTIIKIVCGRRNPD
jgi:hypothetical protein